MCFSIYFSTTIDIVTFNFSKVFYRTHFLS
nr:MAG TPA: hypothetical protein [Caudoviricetes sp.]